MTKKSFNRLARDKTGKKFPLGSFTIETFVNKTRSLPRKLMLHFRREDQRARRSFFTAPTQEAECLINSALI